MPLVLDRDRSEVTIHTTAQGMLSALAHDLDLTARIDRGDIDGERITAYFPIADIAVVGMRRHGKSATHAPSPKDKDEIERRLRSEVFKGAGGDIVVVGHLDGRTATLEVRSAFGRDKVTSHIERRDEDGTTTVRGSCTLSLAALGTGKVSVPMGALRLSDAVGVRFAVTVRQVAEP